MVRYHMKSIIITLMLVLNGMLCNYAQNGMVGDGFGGRHWYYPTNYTVGSYSAYSLCQEGCNSSINQLFGWGANNYNQLGIGSTEGASDIPIPIPNMTNVKYYSTGYMMGAIKNDNTGWTWGVTGGGQNNGISGSPVQVISDVKFLDAGSSSVAFIKSDGTVWSIGINDQGLFGNGTGGNPNAHVYNPSQMLDIYDAVRVAVNRKSTIVLLSDSSLVSAGNGPHTGLGFGQTNVPMPIPGLPKIVDVKSTADNTLALAENGDVYFWGRYNFSQQTQWTPVRIASLSNIVAISGCDDGYHFLVLDSLMNCYAFGDNSGGQCGTSSVSNAHIPYNQPILVATNVVDIMAGENFSYIVKSGGDLYCSGVSEGGTIWFNLLDFQRDTFTMIDPSVIPDFCLPTGVIVQPTPCTDTTFGSIRIDAFGENSPYLFSLGGTYQSESVFNGLSNGAYEISVQDSQGCITNVATTIGGLACPELPDSIVFPNVFTPNNDGANDFFLFESHGVSNLVLTIYNRWGKMVRTIEGTDAFWDGKTANGVDCSGGVYYYMAQFKNSDQKPNTHKGYVSLIR